MPRVGAPWLLALGWPACFQPVAASQSRHQLHLTAGRLPAPAPGDEFGGIVPGKWGDWQKFSELLVSRTTPISESKTGFVFCALPRNGATPWKQLMLRIAGVEYWNSANKTLVHHPTESGLHLVGLRGGRKNASDILTYMGPASKTVKAVMVRDPITRFLSAYLDRCLRNKEWYRCKTKPDARLPQVVAAYEARGDSPADTSFKNQTEFCGLMYDNFTTYDIYARYERFTDASRNILEAANLWNEFGASGWGREGDKAFGELDEPTGRMRERGTAGLVCQYYNVDLLERVAALYTPDIQRFGYRPVKYWSEKCEDPWKRRAAKTPAVQ